MASSATPEDKDCLANCQTNKADVLRRSGRLDEALAACELPWRCVSLWSRRSPEQGYAEATATGLGETYLRLGQVHGT